MFEHAADDDNDVRATTCWEAMTHMDPFFMAGAVVSIATGVIAQAQTGSGVAGWPGVAVGVLLALIGVLKSRVDGRAEIAAMKSQITELRLRNEFIEERWRTEVKDRSAIEAENKLIRNEAQQARDEAREARAENAQIRRAYQNIHAELEAMRRTHGAAINLTSREVQSLASRADPPLQLPVVKVDGHDQDSIMQGIEMIHPIDPPRGPHDIDTGDCNP
jgi:hypothetical protein